MSIQEIKEKINTFSGKRQELLDDILLVIIILLVAGGAFGLGKLSEKNSSKPTIMVGEEPRTMVPLEEYITHNEARALGTHLHEEQVEGVVVASKKGTKYHFPWCSGAQTMKEENKVYFDTIDEARNAGYMPAGNCSGLE